MKRNASKIAPLVLALSVAAIYAYRAADGVVAGLALREGRRLALGGHYDEALPLLERSARGLQRFEQLWQSGEARLGVWDDLAAKQAPAERLDAVLARAAGDYLEAASACPPSGWPWAGLAAVYERRDRAARAKRPLDLSRLGEPEWTRLGRDGAVAVGLARKGVAISPNVFGLRDELVKILLDLGLRESAREALRESARVQPIPVVHEALGVGSMPPDLMEAFAAGAREALGNVSLTNRATHLVGLGTLERKLGHLDQAETDLRAALAEPAAPLTRAEAAFHLALVLIDKGDARQARVFLAEADKSPAFRQDVAWRLASLAEASGDLRDALDHLQTLRRIDPRNRGWALEVARVARKLQDWNVALEALRWAVRMKPDDASARAALVETLHEKGDMAAASSALAEFERTLGRSPETERLGKLLGD
jgi:tetratricopeptide (TPR) repeat protein